MTNPTSIFDHAKIRNAIWTTGATVNEIGFQVHIAAKQLQHIVDGKPAPLDINIETLRRLADYLGLPLHSLFAQAGPPPLPADEPPRNQAAEDATTVIAVLYDRGSTPTVNHDLASALKWDLARLLAAYDEADRRLSPAGLRLVRASGRGCIVPIKDHTATRAAVTHAQSHNTATAIKSDAYRAIHQILSGSPVLPKTSFTRRRFILGEVAKLGIVDLQPRTPALTAATLDAFPD